MAKNFYHSHLVKEGEMDITLTCNGPVDSKFKGQPPFISFKYNGEEYYYPIENDACGEALSGLKGQTVTIKASGGRDDAEIEILSDSAPAQKNTRQQQPPQRQQPSGRAPAEKAPALTPEQAFKKLKMRGARVAVALEASLRFAQVITDKIKMPWTTEDVRAIAMTHFIETKNMIDLGALPTSFPTEAPAASQKAPPRQPDPEPEPEPEQPEEPDDAGEDVPW